MSMEILKKALQKMPATGANGFEELTKQLLELILDERFVLARTGDQPSGDAHNLHRNICVQSKRYTNSSPNAKNIEGDFDENLRRMPNTDIYVIAVTRCTAQLDDTLNAMREKSSVDIVIWDFATAESALPTLCIEYWKDLQLFPAFKKINSQLNEWTSTQRKSSTHKACFDRRKSELKECTQTLATVKTAASGYMHRKFMQSKEAGSVPLQSIDLTKAISRPRYCKRLSEWWNNKEGKVLVLKAPEGHGKTWVAAQCAYEINKTYDAIVLWLESRQWHECATIEDILSGAIACLGFDGCQSQERLVRKLMGRWSERTLIILDGVNERNALPAAQKILEDLATKYKGKFRLLFTTRPLDAVRCFDPTLWNGCLECKVEPFDESELNEALAKMQIPDNELSAHLSTIARIPRYFTACVRLRSKLQRFENISVPLVLWIDLLEKIDGLEPDIRKNLGFTTSDDAEEILVKLATSLPAAVNKGEAQDLLNDCFNGKYGEVRHYLQEIRILKKAGTFEATLSKDHTTLGRALLLQQISKNLPSTDIQEAADLILERLEPFANEDGGTEALFVALQLSAINQSASNTASRQLRAALLHAWVLCQNSNASEQRLEFWCSHDIDAYADFIVAFFEKNYAGKTQEFVANPLGRCWRDNGRTADSLSPHLRRWLLLVWNKECTGEFLEHQGYQLPVAKSENQIRLSSLAISILSLRPDVSFLSELGISLATERLTVRQLQQHSIPFKSIHENVGILMRWRYTEEAIPELEQLAQKKHTDHLLVDGLRRLASAFRLDSIPSILKLPPPKPVNIYCGTPAVELIRQRHSVFVNNRFSSCPNELNFGYLAVRDDLPKLSDEDVHAIKQAVQDIVTGDSIKSSKSLTFEDYRIEVLWPWLAKYHSHDMAKIAGIFFINALKREQPHEMAPVFIFLSGVMPKFDEFQIREWITRAEATFAKIKLVNKRFDNYVGIDISKSALLALPEELVHGWFVHAAHDEVHRYCMHFNELPELISLVAPTQTKHLAVNKCFELGKTDFSSVSGLSPELDYWCHIAALTTDANEVLYAWAKQHLLDYDASSERSFSLIRLWLRSAPPERLESDLCDSRVAKLLDNTALRAWAITGKLNFNPTLLTRSYDELIGNLPQGFVGGVLVHSKRDEDLNRWGKELFGMATKHVGKPPFQRQSRIKTVLHLRPEQMFCEVGVDISTSTSKAFNSYAGSWGIDNDSLHDILANQQNHNALFMEEFDRLRVDEDQLKKWEGYDLHLFGAWFALEAWSKAHPSDFITKAQLLLDAVKNDLNAQWHIGGFLNAVICCLLPFHPEDAWKHYTIISNGRLNIRVEDKCRVPEFYIYLWDLNRCRSPKHEFLRRNLFRKCKNDYEVMTLTLAALKNQAESGLLEFVEILLADKLSRERALGVSILAWIGTQETADRLNTIKVNDESSWVREHAQWAYEVALQEKSARCLFRQLCREPDPFMVSAGLQVLKPALSPLAPWWTKNILNEEQSKSAKLKPKSAALMEIFLHKLDAKSSSTVLVFKRRLDEFCRGEHLDKFKSEKLAPWWDLS